MSTSKTAPAPRPFEGLCVSAVAKATGLSRSTIFTLASTAGLGSPRHFWMPERGDVIYTPEGLCALIDFMVLTDRADQAAPLREIVARERQKAATAAGVTTPDSAEVRGWAARHEAQQDELYGQQEAA